MLIRLGYSPDPDDAYMFWGLSAREVETRGFAFEHVLGDIRTLNRWALEGRLEVTAISLHAYPFVQKRYAILPHGVSMGAGVGPLVVARGPTTLDRLRETEIVVPGRLTTAFLLLRLYLGRDFRFREAPPDEIVSELAFGRAEAGVLPGEAELGYEGGGLEVLADLGEWWLLETGLPLPLGIKVARRDLGSSALRELSGVLGESIAAGLGRRVGALALAGRPVAGFGKRPEDYGDEGREAVRELLERGERAGAYDRVRVEFVA